MTAEIAALVPQIPDIPGPPGRMAALLFVTFVLHLLLMNAVVGGTLITLVNLIRKPGEAESGRRYAAPLPKGMALVVNLGIPPLLFIQALRGSYFYSASQLSAFFWLGVPFVVMFAYYGLYIYTSHGEVREGIRRTALATAAVLLLGNAFLFVNNATLIQSPGAWTAYAREAGGTLLNLSDPEIWPRWLHVIISCFAVGGLCFALPAWIKLRNLARSDAPLPKQQVWLDRMQEGYRWYIGATLCQIPVGLWFLFSLPAPQRLLFMGGSAPASGLLIAALTCAGAGLITAARRMIGLTVGLTVGTVVCMAGLRSLLRASLLEPYGPGGTFSGHGGPIWLFLGSALVTGIVVYRLCLLYRKAHSEESV